MANKNITGGEHSPIFNNCNISIFNQVKYESVMRSKNELYIPLYEELLEINKTCESNDMLSRFYYPFIKEVIQKQYKYRLEDSLLSRILEIDSKIQAFNKIDTIRISGNIITNIFTKGFIELYGDIIDGEAPIYYEDEIVDYEPVYPEEYENIRMIAYDSEFVKNIIERKDDYVEFDYDLYNKSLVTMFEFALADRNKKYSPSRKIINNWKDAPEYYIASISDFYEQFNLNENIIKKRNIMNDVANLSNSLLSDIDNILKTIFERYEKEY